MGELEQMKTLIAVILMFPFIAFAADEPTPSKLRADLQAATDLACAKDAAGDVADPAVCQCNTYLLAKGLPDGSTLSSGVSGPISAAEKLRILKRTGAAGKAKEELNLACAAAWMSIKGDIIEIAALLKRLGL
jgi:hypothetical protein